MTRISSPRSLLAIRQLTMTLCVSGFIFILNSAYAQQDARAVPPPPLHADASAPAVPPTPPVPAIADSAVAPIDGPRCSDALSDALRANPASMPCWANIRTVDRWNTTDIPDGGGLRGSSSFRLPSSRRSNASFVLGSVAGTFLSQHSAPHGYGGLAAVSALMGSRRWQFELEDGGSEGELLYRGNNTAVGLNRAALRFSGETTPRFLWQASATNTYGTDAYRLLAPLDYRIVGNTEGPVAETVAYGLHAGRVTDEQEDVKLRYEHSRRTNWDFVAGHTLQSYSDDGVTVQTLQGRIEVLHALTPYTALGVFATAGHKGAVIRPNGYGSCLLSGGGLRSLTNWSNRAKLNISGGLSGATSACGRSLQLTGDAAFSIRAGQRSWVFLTLDRGFSGGVLEQAPFLSSATTGIRHTFASGVALGVSGAGVLGNNPTTKHQYAATFGEFAVSYHIGPHLTQETTVRRFEADTVGPPQAAIGRSTLTFILWVNPRSAHTEPE